MQCQNIFFHIDSKIFFRNSFWGFLKKFRNLFPGALPDAIVGISSDVPSGNSLYIQGAERTMSGPREAWSGKHWAWPRVESGGHESSMWIPNCDVVQINVSSDSIRHILKNSSRRIL